MLDKSGQGSGEPAVDGFVINPSDSSYLENVPRAIYIGSTGNLVIMTLKGNILPFFNLVGGSILPVRAAKVYSTGTTCLGLIGLY